MKRKPRMSILVDSFAWLELFSGSERGKEVLRLLKENVDKLYTSTLNIYEVRYRIEEIKSAETAEDFIKSIEGYARAIPVSKDIAIEASKIKLKTRMGAVDCNILATARLNGLKLLTGDQHFKDAKEAILI